MRPQIVPAMWVVFLGFYITDSSARLTLAFLLICDDPKTSKSANGARMREAIAMRNTRQVPSK